MTKKVKIFLAASVVLVLLSWHFVGIGILTKYQGTDDQSVALIQELAPDYLPVSKPLFETDNPVTEAFLFALQTAIGLLVLGFVGVKILNHSSLGKSNHKSS